MKLYCNTFLEHNKVVHNCKVEGKWCIVFKSFAKNDFEKCGEPLKKNDLQNCSGGLYQLHRERNWIYFLFLFLKKLKFCQIGWRSFQPIQDNVALALFLELLFCLKVTVPPRLKCHCVAGFNFNHFRSKSFFPSTVWSCHRNVFMMGVGCSGWWELWVFHHLYHLSFIEKVLLWSKWSGAPFMLVMFLTWSKMQTGLMTHLQQ